MEKGSSLFVHVNAFNNIILDLEDINMKVEIRIKQLSCYPHCHPLMSTLLTLYYMEDCCFTHLYFSYVMNMMKSVDDG